MLMPGSIPAAEAMTPDAPGANHSGTGGLRLLRLDLSFRARHSLNLPEFLGDPMRSAFGWALKHLTCVLRNQRDCLPCSLRGGCPYGSLYEPLPMTRALHPSFTEGVPPYVFDPPSAGAARCLQAGDPMCCGITLLPGHRLGKELLVLVGRTAFSGNKGFLGDSLVLNGLEICQTEIGWPDPAPDLRPQAGQKTNAALELVFETPLALKRQGEDVTDARSITVADISRLLWRRVQQTCQLANHALPDGRPWLEAFLRLSIDHTGLRRVSGWRRDSRGRLKHAMAGFVGSVILRGPAADLAVARGLLAFCQPLHIGRHTVFGLGRYVILPV